MGASSSPIRVAELHSEAQPAVRARRGTRDSSLRRLLGAGDALSVLLALVVAVTLPQNPAGAGHQLLWGLVAVPIMLLLFKLYGLYERDAKRISHSTADDLPSLFHAVVIGGLAVWLYSRFSPMHRLYFLEVLLFGVAEIVLVITVRCAVRRAAVHVIGFERALLVGGGDMAQALVGKLAAHPEYRLEVIGSLAPDGVGGSANDAELPRLGTLEELDQIVARHDVTRVLFSSREVDERELEALLRRCRALALKVSLLPGLSDVLGPAVEIDDVEGVTVLGVNPPWLPQSSRALKRAMDIAIAAPLLIVFSPLLLLVAIAVKLDSRGPVLFTQERVGEGGRRFRLHKFRTMVIDAEQRRAELLAKSIDPNWLQLENDPRITRVGLRLRRLSIDELPQLWNVLRGEMSMVGPRPLIEAEDERVVAWARGRLDLTPGITGYWQVLGRTRIPFDEMVKLDYLYVMNWSLWEDVRLMLRTLPVVLGGGRGGRGAN